MSDNTSIGWTDATWPVVTGCTHLSEGCDHCYAAKLTGGRLRHLPAYEGLADKGRFNGTVRLLPDRLEWPLHWRKPRRIFVSDMADLFHENVPDEYIARVFAVMASTPQHTYQVLTKRHARLRSLLTDECRCGSGHAPGVHFRSAMEWAATPHSETYVPGLKSGIGCNGNWPLPNVHIGVSAENQRWADIRIPALIETPAAVRFVSAEPLLGPVDLSAWMPPGYAKWRCHGCRRFYSGPVQEFCPDCGREGYWTGSHHGNGRPNGQPLGWVICGGESGPGHRPMAPAWAESIAAQCVAAEVPVFVKQASGARAGTQGAIPDETWALKQFPAPVPAAA